MVKSEDPRSPLEDWTAEHVQSLIAGTSTEHTVTEGNIPLNFCNYTALRRIVEREAPFKTRLDVAIIRCDRGMGHPVPADVDEANLAWKMKMKMDKLKSKLKKAQYCNRVDMKSECRWGTFISNFGGGDGRSASSSNTSGTTNASDQKRLHETLTRRAMNEKILGLEREHRIHCRRRKSRA
jgi:hypothetical protein